MGTHVEGRQAPVLKGGEQMLFHSVGQKCCGSIRTTWWKSTGLLVGVVGILT